MSNVSNAPEPTSEPADGVGAKASAAAAAGADHVGAVVGTAGDEVGNVKDEALHQAHDVLSEARTRVRGQADQQTEVVADRLGDAADRLQSMAASADDPNDPVVVAVREIGHRAGRLGDRLSDRGISGVIDDTRQWAQRRPGLFIGATLAAGVVVGRLLRNSDTGALTDAARPGDNAGTDQTVAYDPGVASGASLANQPTAVETGPAYGAL